jgi:hypothetical protein
MSTDINLQEAAIGYAEAGWRVLRLYGLHSIRSGNLICDCRRGYKCDKSGKHPIDWDWTHLATNDVAVVSRWWDEQPNANIGILMGGGHITIDLDLLKPTDNGLTGLEEWQEIQDHCGLAPETLTARTGSGGLHHVFREPTGHRSGCSLLPALKGAKKIDQRGKGGLIVVSPSLHKSGNRYEWVNEVERALAPEWLYDTLGPFSGRSARKQRTKKSSVSKATPKPRAVMIRDPEVEEKAQELTRNSDPDATLTEATWTLLKEGQTNGDQSRVVFSICLGAAARRFDPIKLFKLMEDPTNRGGLRLREEIAKHGFDRATDWFCITWQKAQLERASCLAPIDQLREEAKSYQWRKVSYVARNGRQITASAKSMPKVLDAAFDLATQYTTTEPMLSQLKIAKIARLSVKPVRYALGGLEALGWIQRGEATGCYNADTYSLVLDSDLRLARSTSSKVADSTFDLLLDGDLEGRSFETSSVVDLS